MKFIFDIIFELFLEFILDMFACLLLKIPTDKKLPIAVRIAGGIASVLLLITVIVLFVMCSVAVISANLFVGLLVTAFLIFLTVMIIFSIIKKFKSR